MGITNELKEHAAGSGADLVGIAALLRFRDYPAIPGGLLEPYDFAVSMAVALDPGVIDEIDQLPTTKYADHYRTINQKLDSIAASVAGWIEARGQKAYAVPASAFADPERLMGHISHKAVARMAGLGWQGKSLLIVTPEHGPRIRLVTVLTDMPLAPDSPLDNRCGDCTNCREACPAGAIRGVLPQGDYYRDRDEAIDLEACNARTITNNGMPGIGARICGVCVRACPWGAED